MSFKVGGGELKGRISTTVCKGEYLRDGKLETRKIHKITGKVTLGENSDDNRPKVVAGFQKKILLDFLGQLFKRSLT